MGQDYRFVIAKITIRCTIHQNAAGCVQRLTGPRLLDAGTLQARIGVLRHTNRYWPCKRRIGRIRKVCMKLENVYRLLTAEVEEIIGRSTWRRQGGIRGAGGAI